MKTKEEKLDKLMSDDSVMKWIRDGKPLGNHWHTRYVGDEDFRELADTAEVLIRALKIRHEKIDSKTLDRIKGNIDNRIDVISLYDSSHKGRVGTSYRWAAIVAFFVMALLVINFFVDRAPSENDQTASQVVKSTAKGQKQAVYLPDGSKVKLNFNSEIRFDSYFNDTSRAVFLSGEAFFEVEKDPTRPFIVVSGDVVTKALGTSFNVDASRRGRVDVTLATGKVLVTMRHNRKKNHQVYLNAGEQFAFDAEKNTSDVHSVKLDEVLAWTNGKIIFKEADGSAVFEKLSNWYGINFQFEDNVLRDHWLYTGEFDNESLFNVLTSIGHVKKFSFQIEKDTVFIFQKD